MKFTPYVCTTCGAVQLRHVKPGNCDREACQKDTIKPIGGSQEVTFAIYQDCAMLVVPEL